MAKKIICSKKIMGQEKFLSKKKLLGQKSFCVKIFLEKIYFGMKNLFGKIYFLDQNNVGAKKIWGVK